MIEQVAFMRLVPTDLAGGDSAQVEPAHIRRGEQPRDQARIARDRRDHQAGTKALRDFVLWNRNHAGKRKQELAVGQWMLWRIAQNDGGPQVGAALVDYQAAAAPVGRAEIARALAVQLAV